MAETQAIPVKKERDSNMELARIVAIVAIVAYHFVRHGMLGDLWPTSYSQLTDSTTKFLLLGGMFLIFGTNVFVMISGYYGIKLSWKKVISFWLLCVFYNIISVLVKEDVTVSSIGHAFFISGTNHWFFKYYFWLLLASPLLNAGIKALSDKELRLIIALGFILTCISGWFFSNGNENGHNVLQLMYMYILGAYLKRLDDLKKIPSYILVIAFFVACLLGMAVGRFYGLRGMAMIPAHNNPFAVVSAVAVFVLISRLSFQSQVVNFVAKSTPAILLLSDMVFDDYVYGGINSAYQSVGLTGKFCLFLLCYLILIFAGSCTIDTIRRIVCDPLSAFGASKADRLTFRITKLCQQQ